MVRTSLYNNQYRVLIYTKRIYEIIYQAGYEGILKGKSTRSLKPTIVSQCDLKVDKIDAILSLLLYMKVVEIRPSKSGDMYVIA